MEGRGPETSLLVRFDINDTRASVNGGRERSNRHHVRGQRIVRQLERGNGDNIRQCGNLVQVYALEGAGLCRLTRLEHGRFAAP